MTGRQKIIKAIHPVLTGLTKLIRGKEKVKTTRELLPAPQSFYLLQTAAINGDPLEFDRFRGKKVLLVNTASDCVYTPQYEGLQKLYDRYRDRLVIIGFPANDFKEQEKGTDQQIAGFCLENYGIDFPLAVKSSVIKGPAQNKVYQWLSNKQENGWNDQAPTWNFSKYLVNEQGMLTHYFDPSVSPLDELIRSAILH